MERHPSTKERQGAPSAGGPHVWTRPDVKDVLMA